MSESSNERMKKTVRAELEKWFNSVMGAQPDGEMGERASFKIHAQVESRDTEPPHSGEPLWGFTITTSESKYQY